MNIQLPEFLRIALGTVVLRPYFGPAAKLSEILGWTADDFAPWPDDTVLVGHGLGWVAVVDTQGAVVQCTDGSQWTHFAATAGDFRFSSHAAARQTWSGTSGTEALYLAKVWDLTP